MNGSLKERKIRTLHSRHFRGGQGKGNSEQPKGFPLRGKKEGKDARKVNNL